MQLRLLLFFVAHVFCGSGLVLAQAWSVPFSKDIAAIRQQAAQTRTPDRVAAHILLDEQKYVIDDKGRITRTIRQVYKVTGTEELEEWSAVEQAFEPWHEAQPRIRARVIAADGAVHDLDPKTVSEAPAREISSSIFSDTRVSRAPLPAIKPGAVVETEIIVRDTTPRFAVGVSERIWPNTSVPVERFHVIVEASASIPLKSLSRLMPDSSVKRKVEGKTAVVECDFGPWRAPEQIESNLPYDVSRIPYFGFSTAPSWNHVAAQYSRIVDDQIRDANLGMLMPAERPTGTPQQIAEQLTARLHREIRYTGVEFGEAALVPRTPAETLRRRYGDCKDKSALLVAMLRSVNLDARVALLHSGYGKDLDAELPGFGLFDHAIVYVGGEHPFWIDATANDSHPLWLPAADAGRLALIAGPDTSALTQTPNPTSKENWRVHQIEVWLNSLGSGRLVENIHAAGGLDADMRRTFGGGEDKPNDQAIANYAKNTYLSKQVGNVRMTPRQDTTHEFDLTIEMKEAGRAATDLDEAVVATLPHLLFSELPYTLTRSSDEEKQDTKRTQPFLMPQPHVIEYRYKIHGPALFRPGSLPESGSWKLGPATYARTVSTAADGTVEIAYRFDTGERSMAPADYEAFRTGLREHNKLEAELLRFTYTPAELLASGDTKKALDLLKAHADAHAGDAIAQVRLARMFVAAGLGAPAMRAARSAVELDPKSLAAWQTLGWAAQHDTFGRRMRGNWNRAEAEKAYAKATELQPDDFTAQVDLAIMHEHNDAGERYGKGSHLKESAAIYQRVLQKGPNPVLRSNLVAALLYAGEYDELRKLINVRTATEMEWGVLATIDSISKGTAQALSRIQTAVADPASRSRVLLGAAQNLVTMRKYEAAKQLLQSVIRLRLVPEAQARLDLVARIKTVESMMHPDTDPRSIVQKFLVPLFTPELITKVDLRSVFASIIEDGPDDSQQMEELRVQLAGMRAQFASVGIPAQVVPDLVLSMIELEKEGDDSTGYKVSAAGPAGASFPDTFVVREKDGYKLLGFSSDVGIIGRLALELLAKSDLKSAQIWLDRAVAAVKPMHGDGTGYPAIRYLWSGVKEETRGPEAVRVASAALISADKKSPESIDILRKARGKTRTEIERLNFDIALCQAYMKSGEWAAMLDASKALRASSMFAADGTRYARKALLELGRWDELARDSEAAIAKNKDDMQAVRSLALARMGQGKKKEAAEGFVALAKTAHAERADKIAAGWLSLLAGLPGKEWEQRLQKETDFQIKMDRDFWYALAAVQAATNRSGDAHRTLLSALDRDNARVLDAQAWLVFGQICSQLGQADEAREALRRAVSWQGNHQFAKWAQELAQEQLKLLPASPK